MAKHTFDIKKTYDEIEVGEQVFQLRFNDEKVKGFRKLAHDYQENAQRIAKVDTTKLNESEIELLEADAGDLLKTVIDSLLGEGSYQKIYKELGESTFAVASFIEYLFEILEERLKKTKMIQAEKYTKKPGK